MLSIGAESAPHGRFCLKKYELRPHCEKAQRLVGLSARELGGGVALKEDLLAKMFDRFKKIKDAARYSETSGSPCTFVRKPEGILSKGISLRTLSCSTIS